MPLTEEQKRMLLQKMAASGMTGAPGSTPGQDAAAGGAIGNTLGNAMSPELLKRLRAAGTAGAATVTPGQEMSPPGQTLLPDSQLMPGQEGVIPPQPAPMEQTPEMMMGPRPTDQQWDVPPEQQMASAEGPESEEEKRKKARVLALQGLARGQAGEGQPLTSGESPILEG